VDNRILILHLSVVRGHAKKSTTFSGRIRVSWYVPVGIFLPAAGGFLFVQDGAGKPARVQAITTIVMMQHESGREILWFAVVAAASARCLRGEATTLVVDRWRVILKSTVVFRCLTTRAALQQRYGSR
jgi:hypothetical protein